MRREKHVTSVQCVRPCFVQCLAKAVRSICRCTLLISKSTLMVAKKYARNRLNTQRKIFAPVCVGSEGAIFVENF